MACDSPVDLGTLSAYRAGELSPEAEHALEEHYFACEECARRLRWVESVAVAVGAAMRDGALSVCVSSSWLAAAEAAGIRVRTYTIEPGTAVSCTAAPDDDFVLVKLRVGSGGAYDLQTDFADLSAGEQRRFSTDDIPADPRTGEILYAFTGAQVRRYPRSRWTMHARPRGGAPDLGPFVMDHTPWAELGSDDRSP